MKLFTPVIYIALSVGLFILLINPEYEQKKALDAKIEENQTMIALAIELRDKQAELQQKNAAIGPEERERLEKILPESVDNVRLILDIATLGEGLGIIIENIGIGDDNASDNNTKGARITNTSSNIAYGTIQLSFSFTSSYATFKEYIRQLEDSLRLVDIVGLKVSPASAAEGPGLYRFGVVLNTYWLK